MVADNQLPPLLIHLYNLSNSHSLSTDFWLLSQCNVYCSDNLKLFITNTFFIFPASFAQKYAHVPIIFLLKKRRRECLSSKIAAATVERKTLLSTPRYVVKQLTNPLLHTIAARSVKLYNCVTVAR